MKPLKYSLTIVITALSLGCLAQVGAKMQGSSLSLSRVGQKEAPITVPTQKHVAPELVGKWCWTNVTTTNSGGSTSERCLTLNADGTYHYQAERSMSVNTDAFYGGTNAQSTDRGTWTYDGQRIYYTSQMGQGSGSYKLEKRNHPRNRDPMIVLDGESYVTYYQKPSW